MPDTLTILIADDHDLIRSGLRLVLESEARHTILEAGTGSDALEMMRSRKPDIALLDIEMPGMSGFDAAKAALTEGTSTDIVFLTMWKDETLFNRAMDLGVKGYVLKENTVSEILQCVKTVMDGRYYVSPALTDYLVRRSSPGRPGSKATRLDKLTPAERSILAQLSEMKTNQEIAATLFISVKTVQNHRNNICAKLGLNGAHALLKFAIENKRDPG